jgi:hypothetical protein
MMLAILDRFEHLDRRGRHDCRDGVLVDQLRMSVAAQKHAEIVEPGDKALQLDAVDQKNRNLVPALAHMVQEGVLQILRFFRRHG